MFLQTSVTTNIHSFLFTTHIFTGKLVHFSSTGTVFYQVELKLVVIKESSFTQRMY